MANVLIVDDSSTSRKLLRNILEENGHTIVGEATNGEEGYFKFQELHPDIVTMDITMPKMDGLEALQMIKDADKNAKVVMITSAGQKSKLLRAIECGASDFLAKPFSAEQITAVMDVLMKGK